MSNAVTGDAPVQPQAPLVLRFAAAMEAVEQARVALLAYLEPCALDDRQLNRIEVVMEELVSNVVRHGGGASFIGVRATCQDGGVTVSVEDDGASFNPLEQVEPPRFDTLENANLGGLGIGLVKRLARSVNYRHEGGCNRVTVVFDTAQQAG